MLHKTIMDRIDKLPGHKAQMSNYSSTIVVCQKFHRISQNSTESHKENLNLSDRESIVNIILILILLGKGSPIDSLDKYIITVLKHFNGWREMYFFLYLQNNHPNIYLYYF